VGEIWLGLVPLLVQQQQQQVHRVASGQLAGGSSSSSSSRKMRSLGCSSKLSTTQMMTR
jgi:hypothetical protein